MFSDKMSINRTIRIFLVSIISVVVVIFFVISAKELPLLAPYYFLFFCAIAIAVRFIYVRIFLPTGLDKGEKKWLFRMIFILFICGLYLFFVYTKALLNAPGHYIPMQGNS